MSCKGEKVSFYFIYTVANLVEATLKVYSFNQFGKTVTATSLVQF